MTTATTTANATTPVTTSKMNPVAFETGDTAIVFESGSNVKPYEVEIIGVTKTTVKVKTTGLAVRELVFNKDKYSQLEAKERGRDRYASHTKTLRVNNDRTREEAAKQCRYIDARNTEKENKAAVEASDVAEMEAFYATPEGAAMKAMEEQWEGTKLHIDTHFSHGRSAQITVINPKTGYRYAEVNVYQYTSSDWTTDERCERLKEVEVNWSGMGRTAGQAKRYAEAILKASEIAAVWNTETGKVWNAEAKVAM